MLETAQLFQATIFRVRSPTVREGYSRRVPALTVGLLPRLILMAIGVLGVIIPLLYPNEWFAPVVWLSFILLVDPINARLRLPSIIGDLERGEWSRLFSLLASGLLCGFLWEFWNYWALSKWTYTVPYFGNIKIFEMPVLGFLGFPPFAVECWAIYILVRWLLQPKVREQSTAGIFLSAA